VTFINALTAEEGGVTRETERERDRLRVREREREREIDAFI